MPLPVQCCRGIAADQTYNTESESNPLCCPMHYFVKSINAKQSFFTPIISVSAHSKPRDKYESSRELHLTLRKVKFTKAM